MPPVQPLERRGRDNVGGYGGIFSQEILKKMGYLRQRFVCFEDSL